MRNIDEYAYRDRNRENPSSDIKPKEVIEERPRDIAIRDVRADSKTPIENDNLLMDQAKAQDFQDRWNAIQTAFVDHPTKAVEDADRLIEEALKHIGDVFMSEREKRQRQSGAETQVSTEDLRLALQRSRAMFARLVAA